MKPTNSKIPPCNPISSNCVIWQGPDIACIDLCNGDTVSDVVAKLATELCELLDELKISTFDLQCLGIPGCPPADFHGLIQLIIDTICKTNNIIPPVQGGCPDCEIQFASCFYYPNPANGDTVISGQLIDYVSLIANAVCRLISQVNTLTGVVDTAASRLIPILPPAPTPIPNVTPQCVLPSVPTPVQLVVSALETQYCNLVTATGAPSRIFNAMTRECNDLGNQERLYGSGTMSTITNWINTETSFADNLNNMWLTICDMRAAIMNIQLNCCPSCCDGVDVMLQVALLAPSTLKIYLTGTIPAGFIECTPTGTLFTISDTSGGSITITIPVISNLNQALGFSVNLTATPINLTDNITVHAVLCLSPADATTGCSECQSLLNYTLVNTLNCPAITFASSYETIGYSFVHSYGSASYTLELWNSSLSVLIASQTIPAPIPQSIASSFTGLTMGTAYWVKFYITVNGTTRLCDTVPVSTFPDPCPPPTNVTVEFNYVIS